MIDFDTIPLRNAIVSRLEADPVLLAACTVDRIYGDAMPSETEWPFVRYGFPIETPKEATGFTGSRNRITIHVFARGPSMDECSLLGNAAAKALDGIDLELQQVDGSDRLANTFELICSGIQTIRDGDDDWHCVIEFDVSIAGA